MTRWIAFRRSWALLFTLIFCWSSQPVFAAAPTVQQDPAVNISSLYAFVGTKFNDSTVKVLNVVVDFHPLTVSCEPFAYSRFSDDVRYTINIANPATGALILSYNFRFTPVSSAAGKYKNKAIILSYGRGTTIGSIQHTGDSAQNFTQQYAVKKTVVSPAGTVQIGGGLSVPPPNVGLRTTPAYNDASGRVISGATTNAGLDTYTRETIHALSSGEVVWAGAREDSLFGDFGCIADLLNPRILGPDGHGQTGSGIDTRAGQNVLTIAMQIPLTLLPAIQYTDAFTGVSHGIGIYATTARQQTLTRSVSGDPVPSGSWVQVARMGNPFFNDFFIAIQDQDKYQRDVPTNDSAKYKKYASTPELAVLVNAIFRLEFCHHRAHRSGRHLHARRSSGRHHHRSGAFDRRRRKSLKRTRW